jgi:Xaa-Pro aminopeptidase
VGVTEAFLERRRAATAAAWNLDGGVVLVAAGDEIPVPGRGDRTYPFRAHSEYLYLTDRERPGGVLAYAPADGWVEFVAPVTADELLWTGLEGDREGVPEGTRPTDELEAWVGDRPVRPLGAAADADVELRDALIHVRRPKDDVELERMRKAAEATRAGFEELLPLIAAGRTERELKVTLEAAFLRNGGDFLAFETIVAAGDHAAVLHFSPTARELRDGDLLLVDAGAEHRGYASDVTRTYAVGGTFTAEQALVHDTVRRAGETAIAACRPGTDWHDVHRAAALVIAEGLVELGVLRGSPETLVDSGAATLFFPHTASATWSASASATPARPPARRASPWTACHACGSTSRSRRATRGRSSRGSTSSPRCSPENAAATASTGIASTTCTASAACASSRTC